MPGKTSKPCLTVAAARGRCQSVGLIVRPRIVRKHREVRPRGNRLRCPTKLSDVRMTGGTWRCRAAYAVTPLFRCPVRVLGCYRKFRHRSFHIHTVSRRLDCVIRRMTVWWWAIQTKQTCQVCSGQARRTVPIPPFRCFGLQQATWPCQHTTMPSLNLLLTCCAPDMVS